MKLLFWAALIALVVFAVRKKAAGAARRGRERDEAARAARTAAAGAEAMLQCRHCGVHIPASEALVNARGESFCSDEHLRLRG